jgi:hypothetical protein
MASVDLSGGHTGPKKFLNGWTSEQEKLMAQWADIAGCYRWLHDSAEKKFSRRNLAITIPVIILSTLTGTANFAIGSFIPADDTASEGYAQAVIGAISIFAGILTTLGNFLRYAQGSEAHRVSGIAWGKFQRQIAVELALNPNDRMDCMDFLGICRQDLDRLIEQSPQIPDKVIAEFEVEFKDQPTLKRPDICHGLEHTSIFNSNKSRLVQLTSDATIFLKQRKKMLRDEILPDLSQRINTSVESELAKKLEERVKIMEAEMRSKLEAMTPARSSIVAVPVEEGMPNLESDWRRFLVTRRVQEMNMPATSASTEELVTPVSVVIHTNGNSSPAVQGPSGSSGAVGTASGAVGTASGAVGPEGIDVEMGGWATGATGDVSGNTIVSTPSSVPTFTVSME